MPLSFTEFFGNNTRLTESLCQLYLEIIACQGMRCWDGTIFVVTNLGELGDARHQAEPTSRHNPMACPDNVWRICACDFGGQFAAYTKLAQFWQALYRAHDDRVYYYGFAQFGDGYGIAWGTGNKEFTGRDNGHCHIDVNMADASLANYSSFVPSMTSRRAWNLAYFLTTGRLGTNPTPEIQMTAADQANINAHTDAAMRVNILQNVVPKLQGIQTSVDNLASAIAVSTSGLFSDGGAVYTQVEGGKAWLSWIDYLGRGRPPVRKVGSGDPLLALTTVGPQPDALRVVVQGTTTYAIQGGKRVALDKAALALLPVTRYPRQTATAADLAVKEVTD